MGLLFYLKIQKAQSRINCAALCRISSFKVAGLLLTGLLLFTADVAFAQQSLLDKTITIPRQHITLYDALELISQKAECLFIYDSQIVENDKRVKLEANNEPVKLVLDHILFNPDLGYKVIGQHILIYKIAKGHQVADTPIIALPPKDTLTSILIKGHVYDNENKSVIPFVSIGIVEENIGTITNADGYFTVKVPASYSGAYLVVSHIGYSSQKIPIQLLREQKVDIYLQRRVISLQEVIIRYFDPNTIIKKAMELRKANNRLEPVYTTAFYREGVQKNNRFISYSEAVFKVYKSPYTLSENSDQVKLLKSRKFQNSNPRDTVYVKLKAGVLSALQLDIVKCVPGFLDQSEPSQYTYSYSDLVSYNSRDAYVISFIQNAGIAEALYKGTLYIDKDNFAILGADFEINPNFLDRAAENLILKKSHRLTAKLEKISYSVSYTPFDGKYYLNHARCDIKLKTRLRNHFSSDEFNTFLELATCHIDTLDVNKFPRQEVIKPNVVFSDALYESDETFWGDFNTIAPEEKINDALSKLLGKLEKIE